MLVVDDEAPIRLLCRVNLEAHGFEVVEAKDGLEGLAVAQVELPDLILLGVMMPRMDGWEAAERLQQNRTTRAIPIVFLTARSKATERLRGMELGALDYLTKPFDPAELPFYVERLLAGLALGRREQIRGESLRKIRELLEAEARAGDSG